MSSSLRRGTLAASTLALSVAVLTACGAGNNAQTLGVKPDNAATSVGDIKIQAASFVTSEEGEGPAAITARIFNSGERAQTLQRIKINGTSLKVALSPAKGEKGKAVTVPAGGDLTLGGKGNASAVITEGASAIKNGAAQPVTFDFSNTGDVKLRALVVPGEQGDFKRFGPSVQPSEPSGSPSGDASGEPSGSPSASEGAGNDEQPGADESGEPGAGGSETGQPDESGNGAENPAGSSENDEHAEH